MTKQLYILAAVLMLATDLPAQTPRYVTGSKTDVRIERILNGAASANRRSAAHDVGRHNVIINAADASLLADKLKADGCKAMAVSENVLTATLPTETLRRIAASDEVRYIRTPRKFRLYMDNTRMVTNADQVHAGTGLDTPFDGTGVIIGVIDEGFEYRHAAFLDEEGNSRVKRFWLGGESSPTTEVSDEWDGYNGVSGHATHTTNIAAGSDTGNGLYGIAPKADIYMIPSNFEEDEILQGLKYLSDYSRSEGKPCVVNMSYGSQIGPHDGTTEFDQTADHILGSRLIACAAMGNEGRINLHGKHSFTSENQLRNIVFNIPSSYNEKYEDIYEKILEGIAVCSATDGEKHLAFRPFVLSGGQKMYPTEEQFNYFSVPDNTYEEVNAFSGHQQYYFKILGQRLLQTMGVKSAQFGLEITGNPGDVVNVWVEYNYGNVGTPSGISDASDYIQPDNIYCVAEASSSIPQSISVAAVNGSTNKIADFSSVGPWLGDEKKPTIAAPGVNIKSAICKFDPSFNPKDLNIDKVSIDGNTYYYGIKSGTSMATPVVTGAVALWLQAYPDMSREELMDIIRTTSRHSEYNPDEWDERYGYGVIDVYAGLKKALEQARVSGVNEMFNTPQPVSLQVRGGECRVLFNNDESFADISLVSAAGRRVLSRSVVKPRRGEEQVVSMKDLLPGVYVFNVRTTSQTKTAKVLVQ